MYRLHHSQGFNDSIIFMLFQYTFHRQISNCSLSIVHSFKVPRLRGERYAKALCLKSRPKLIITSVVSRVAKVLVHPASSVYLNIYLSVHRYMTNVLPGTWKVGEYNISTRWSFTEYTYTSQQKLLPLYGQVSILYVTLNTVSLACGAWSSVWPSWWFLEDELHNRTNTWPGLSGTRSCARLSIPNVCKSCVFVSYFMCQTTVCKITWCKRFHFRKHLKLKISDGGDIKSSAIQPLHDDVMPWECFLHHWYFKWRIHWTSVDNIDHVEL